MPKRVLIIANEFIVDAKATLPSEIKDLIENAQQVLVVAPTLTTTLQSWVSDIDGARAEADERMRRIETDMRDWHQPTMEVGDEDQLLAVEDALAHFDADALVIVVHAPEIQNHHEHGVAERLRERFGVPATVLVVDGSGRLIDQRTS